MMQSTSAGNLSGRLRVGAGLLAWLWPVVAFGSFPVVTTARPSGAVRGQEATLTFSGTRLGDAYTAISDHPGIEIISVVAVDGSNAKVTFRSRDDLPPGLYPIRLVTHTGVANVRLVGIGVLPIVEEKEPNQSFESAQKIDIDCTVDGRIAGEDVDWFVVSLRAGERVSVEIEGMRLTYDLNNRLFDPLLTVFDAEGNELIQSDDSVLLGQDTVCSWQAATDGDYRIMVRDTLFSGGPDRGYRLHVGRFPRPLAVIAKSQTEGALDVEVHAVDGTRRSETLSIASVVEPQSVPLVIESDAGIAPSPNWTRLSPLPIRYEVEPNDQPRKAPPFDIPAALCGVLDENDSHDCFAFRCRKGESYRVSVFARNPLRSPIDTVCHVFDPNYKVIKGADDVGRSKDSSLEFTAAMDGQYVLRVYDQRSRGGPTFQYRMEVEQRKPAFHLTLKELRRSEAGFAAIPAGGRGAVVVQTARQGFNGPIDVSVEGLPEGITSQCFSVPAGRNEIPILFEAPVDSAHGVSLVRLSGTGKQDEALISGTFDQEHKLVLGQNRRPLWTHRTRSATVAVTEKAPFSIELIHPKTPIVRQGSKSLRVKIVRDSGFDQPVRIRSLYNPPGVHANNSRRIAGDQSEVDIPISANRGAAIGKWPIILLANYPAPQGNCDLATNAIELDVQPEMFAFKFPRVTAEQGAAVEVEIPIEIERPYQGDAEIQLAGLPRGVSSDAPIQKITPESKAVRFPIKVAADAKPGRHKTLVCIARIKVNDETIVQTTGRGEIRIDRPISRRSGKQPAQPVKGEQP